MKDEIEKLHIDFNSLISYYKGPTAAVSFTDFIVAITRFDKIKSSRINSMNFQSKMSNIRIGGRTSEKQGIEIKSSRNVCNGRDCHRTF